MIAFFLRGDHGLVQVSFVEMLTKHVYLIGITNSNIDGVVAFYPTKNINCSELFHLLVDVLIEIPFQTSCIITGLLCKF